LIDAHFPAKEWQQIPEIKDKQDQFKQHKYPARAVA
jgi:hypothetical protein